MNVKNNRSINKVVVLGSGMSILDLTKKEVEYINRCNYVIAMNKFMGFYRKCGILPTHIYFHDRHGNNFKMFKYIMDTCINDKLENLTIITNSYFKLVRKKSTVYNLYSSLVDIIFHRLKYFIKQLVGKELDASQRGKLYQSFEKIEYPPRSTIVAVSVSHWLKGVDWGKSLKNKLFHFRGSLTTVLNYCSISFPGMSVYLVGNDFNSAQYFFQEELEQLDFEWRDFTSQKSKEDSLHFSFQDFKGTKMTDCLPFVVDEMLKSGNHLFCINKDSLLVTEGGIEYKNIMDEQ